MTKVNKAGLMLYIAGQFILTIDGASDATRIVGMVVASLGGWMFLA